MMRRLFTFLFVFLVGSALADYSGPTVPANVISQGTGVIVAALAAGAGAGASNQAALQAAAAQACANGGYTTILLPSGRYYLTLNGAASSASIYINCPAVSVVSSGGSESTHFIPSGTGDFIVYQAPNNVHYVTEGTIRGVSFVRTDSPSSGRGLFLDHTLNVNVFDSTFQGAFTDLDCNACSQASLINSRLGGVELQTGSNIVWLRHTNATLTTTGPNVGAVIPVASTANLYVAQSYVSGDSNIQAGTRILSYDPVGLTITLSLTPTGTTGTGDTLVFSDGNTDLSIGSGTFLQGNAGASPWNYDHAVLDNDSDGLWIAGGVHLAWTRGAPLYKQPGDIYADVGGVVMDPAAWVDSSGGCGIETEPFGGFTTTLSAPLSTSSTAMSIAATPPTNINSYDVQINGVTVGTTVASGGTTTTLTLSADPIANTASGATVTFYPAGGTTGYDGDDNINGIIQGQADCGVLANDPQWDNVNSGSLSILDMQTQALRINAGTHLNFSNINIKGPNLANGSYSGALVQGNADWVTIGGTFQYLSNKPPYWLDQEGQAGAHYVLLTTSGLNGSLTADAVNNSTGHGYCSTSIQTDSASPGCFRVFATIGSNILQFVDSSDVIPMEISGGTSQSTYVVFSASNANQWSLHGQGGTNPITGSINASTSVAGVLDIGSANLDTFNAGGPVKASGGYTVATLPTGAVGDRAYVTDQLTTCAAAGAALTGGGSVKCPVFYNGSAWVGD